MTTVFVRVNPKKKSGSFYRAGLKFTNDFSAVEVSDEALEVLQGESMLDVSLNDPGIVGSTAGSDGAVEGDLNIGKAE